MKARGTRTYEQGKTVPPIICIQSVNLWQQYILPPQRLLKMPLRQVTKKTKYIL